MRLLVYAIGFFVCAIAHAGPLTYKCTVGAHYELASDGSLQPLKKAMSASLGSEFYVDRRSGVVIGGGIGNASYPTKTIIDPGGPAMAFKLLSVSADVATTKNGKNAIYLTVQEYANSVDKPFVATDNMIIITGRCN
jgi:hypothetical protein